MRYVFPTVRVRRRNDKMHFGHKLQITWVLVGGSLQLWIGGIKGFVVMIAGIIIFHINSTIIGKQIRLNHQRSKR